MKLCLSLAFIVAGLAFLLPQRAVSQPGGTIIVGDVTGAIGIATTMHVENIIERAKSDNAELVVLRINTPGGLVTSTRSIAELILGSPVPVAVYVSPSGAHAASAGTFITYAGHIAAMAPGTQIGAATPIEMGGVDPMTPKKPTGEDGEEPRATPPEGSAADRKSLNDAVAFIKSLAELRGRNIEWAEKAVRDAATLTASEALQQRVVEFIASDLDDLLRQMDGRVVKMTNGEKTLATTGRTLVYMEIDWRTEFLGVVSDPNVAYILLMIGLYGIIFEFWNPGFVAPGVIGAICLLVALMALTALPVNYAGLALVLLGIAFMVGEVFVPSFGIIGIGGAIAFVLGSLFLFDPTKSDFGLAVAWPLIAAATVTTGVFTFAVAGLALQAQRRPIVSGSEGLMGAPGQVVEWSAGAGAVRVQGEIWAATSNSTLAIGQQIRVVGRSGLTLQVESF